ncbi:MAG: hydrogenase nickel incorporation protein HypB [Deltaproteobacteria bacterium]|nr:hydrogenase nickel incorporation protein HypB [Deltaproteobacteria bacterium]
MHDILIEEKILSRNDAIAADNRKLFRDKNIFAINMVSSPGAGKTTLIEKMVPYLKERVQNFSVIEGDLATDLDSQRLSKYGVPVRQINTGKACHLDAHNISHVLPWLFEQQDTSLLIIENVGNMVCPAEYDLGEDMMATVMSSTEGDDKPLKYPAIFNASDVLIINKTDLVPYTNFDIGRARENALKINPNLVIFETSCKTGMGVREWSDYLSDSVKNRPVSGNRPLSEG